MDDYDRRQIEDMLGQLHAYEVGRVDLSWLISSLEALLESLENTPTHWRDELRRHWAVLEQVYSVAVARAQPIESPDNRALLMPALKAMRVMLGSALSE
ncbi:MAG: hypothetical protein RLZZ450_4906 [Pseudomonadota bacterium]|jgi:hypothetical protein